MQNAAAQPCLEKKGPNAFGMKVEVVKHQPQGTIHPRLVRRELSRCRRHICRKFPAAKIRSTESLTFFQAPLEHLLKLTHVILGASSIAEDKGCRDDVVDIAKCNRVALRA